LTHDSCHLKGVWYSRFLTSL